MLVGVLGGGQLGRMLALAGIPLGLRFRFLDPDPLAPARDVGEVVVGDFEDQSALARFADGLDVVTYEFENVPADSADWLAQRVQVWPPVHALRTGQDRVPENEAFTRAGLAMHPKVFVQSHDEIGAAMEQVGLPCVMKSRRGGYDGKGLRVVHTLDQARAAFAQLGAHGVVLEAFVPFERELSLVGVRGIDARFDAYPLVENRHESGILRETSAPAPHSPDVGAQLERDARVHMQTLMEGLGYVGVMAIEFFEFKGRLLANEMAPRVHNTGHWTIEGARTSQFENHCRAILGLPLGSCEAVGQSVMLNLIGDIPSPRDVLAIAGTHLHLYGKKPRPGRKVGHVTVSGLDAPEMKRSVAKVRGLLLPEPSPRP